MKKIILLLTILIVNGLEYSDPNSCRIFDLDKFTGSTELDIGQIAEFCSDKSKVRIYKGTNLIFPTTDGFTRRYLPSKFTIEFDYKIKVQPTCTWTLISITDWRQNELFSVSLDPEKKLVKVSFTDRLGKCFSSFFFDYKMSFNSRRRLIIEVDYNEVNVFIDYKPLKYYGGNFNENSDTRAQIDLSNTETKLFRQGGDKYSVEMDINSFIILSSCHPQIGFSFLQSGSKGEPGRDGFAGYKGSKGDKGEYGRAGSNGSNGEKGDKCETIYNINLGPKGETGAVGDTGSNGLTGPNGLPGNDGTPGQNGDDGDSGSSGSTGEAGAKGDNGDDGLDGVRGPRGPAGQKGGQMTEDDIRVILLEIINNGQPGR